MCLCFYVSHMLFVRDKPRSLQWHILKYENFVSAPDVVTKSLLEFLGIDILLIHGHPLALLCVQLLQVVDGVIERESCLSVVAHEPLLLNCCLLLFPCGLKGSKLRCIYRLFHVVFLWIFVHFRGHSVVAKCTFFDVFRDFFKLVVVHLDAFVVLPIPLFDILSPLFLASNVIFSFKSGR